MEAAAMYLLKSALWLSGFAVVFIFFLKNERSLILNRAYLLTGLLASFVMPFITVYYNVDATESAFTPVAPGINAFPLTAVPGDVLSGSLLLITLYLAGVLIIASRSLWQVAVVQKSISNSGRRRSDGSVILPEPLLSSSFSFFSRVFVNPSLPETPRREILHHEMEHVRQKHWIDLLFAEMLCIIQWFNPMVWLYTRFIRQNHEYLADRGALQQSSDPALYKALLLNQIVGEPVISLVNSFNYSLTKKRFNMMKNIVSAPGRKLRYTLILPVIALLLYSFAKPEYSVAANIQTTQDGVVKGRVVLKDGKPLEMVAIIINGTTTATATDAEGKFTLNGVSRDATLNVVHYGYIPMVVRPRFDSEMKITLEEDNKGQFNGVNSMTPPPPPPPPPAYSFPDGKKPLILVDGKITDISIQQIDPETIESISVWKDKTATDKYGDKGKDGVIEIRLKKNTGSNEVIVVEGKPLNGESSAIIVRSASASSSNEPVTVIGYGQPKEGFLYLVDGEVKDKAFVDALGTDKIESMSVWKGQKAIDKYGEKGRNGVIEIVTKK